jgi:hypothetical protein
MAKTSRAKIFLPTIFLPFFWKTALASFWAELRKGGGFSWGRRPLTPATMCAVGTVSLISRCLQAVAAWHRRRGEDGKNIPGKNIFARHLFAILSEDGSGWLLGGAEEGGRFYLGPASAHTRDDVRSQHGVTH